MPRPKIAKPLNPALLEALRLLNDEVPEACTPAEAWKLVRPETPKGAMSKRLCFWGILWNVIGWRNEIPDHRAELVAAWIKTKKTLHDAQGQPWPPVPLLDTAQKPLPQPWTGKEEKRISHT